MIRDKLRNVYEKAFHKKTSEDIELEYRLQNGMKVGHNCHIYSASTIDGAWPWLITIGDNVTISTNVTILAHDARPNVVGCGTKLGRVDIGNNVFIGTGAIILCNTTIGDNVIVAAGSVVSKSLPSNGVYGGNPARKICQIEEYKQRYLQLRKENVDFSSIRPWDEWCNATSQEKQNMAQELKNSVGFI